MAIKAKNGRRLDKDRLTLRKGETQRKNGMYDYRWTSPDGRRHSIYAPTLEELRKKEEEILQDQHDGIKIEVRQRFYNTLADAKILTIATIDNIYTILHQVFDMAVDDSYLHKKPNR